MCKLCVYIFTYVYVYISGYDLQETAPRLQTGLWGGRQTCYDSGGLAPPT